MLFKRLFFANAFPLILLLSSPAVYGQKKEEKAVRECFDGYNQDILSFSGRDLLVYAINQGMISYGNPSGSTLIKGGN